MIFRKKEKIPETTSETVTEMSFLDHIGELRKRIILALVWFIIGSSIAGVIVFQLGFIDKVLLRQATLSGLELQNLKPFGQPFMYFKVTMVLGIIISFPMMLYQLWKFIAPGLYDNERKWVRNITIFTSLSFFLGVAFSYFLMIPSMLSFAASFGSEKIKNIIDINEYFSFLTMMLLASGILFEMPIVSFILSRVGILTPKIMRKYRRHGIIIILVLAAVLTPTPDPISQLIFASPLFILYEISILVAKLGEKKHAGK
jgi:sec-independent protein translocase protein TatC